MDKNSAMYKTRNTGIGEQNAGNAGNTGNVIFRGMSSNIPGHVVKHSVESMKGFG